MTSFEKEYYETAEFWQPGVLENEGGTLERIRATIALIPSEVQSLVDVGCGNGLFLNTLAATGRIPRLLGIDRSETALAYVKTDRKLGDVTQIDLDDRSFDCASCLQVLEHIPVPVYDAALAELARVASRYMVVSVPFAEDLEDGRTTCPACGSSFNANLHLRSYSKESFRAMFKPHGFECVTTELCGPSTTYRFHKQYRRIVDPAAHKRWFSPICPVCGYSGRETSAPAAEAPERPRTRNPVLAAIKWLPKQLWPRETRFYWIIGLFRRTQTGL